MKKNMMMNWKINSIILIFFLTSHFSAAQEGVYILHPSIGDTIDRVEKLDYSIFPKTHNPDFKEAYITMKNDSFFLNAIYFENFKKERYLPKEEIIEAQKGIEKVNAYYRLLADSSKTNYTSTNYNSDKMKMDMKGALGESAKKEARMYQRLQEDQRRAKMIGRGTDNPQEIRIEFK
jgi:hypothetical protein